MQPLDTYLTKVNEKTVTRCKVFDGGVIEHTQLSSQSNMRNVLGATILGLSHLPRSISIGIPVSFVGRPDSWAFIGGCNKAGRFLTVFPL